MRSVEHTNPGLYANFGLSPAVSGPATNGQPVMGSEVNADEMLALANRNREQAGVTNATFLKGSIEQAPLPGDFVDVVISNCVINLADDKGAVLREAFRVLKPGGRLAVSDMVELEPLPEAVKSDLDPNAGSIAGTLPVEQYRGLLLEAGFQFPEIGITGEQSLEGPGGRDRKRLRARSQACRDGMRETAVGRLGRPVAAELVGTAFLVAAVIGAGVAAQRLLM